MTQSAPATELPPIPRHAWPALWALVVGFFMILVDSTIVSVAIPTLMDHFHAGVNSVLWVTSAYLLAYAVPLLITGRLGDRFGPRNVYLLGLAVFTLASLWCGLTQAIGELIGARVAQGLGASLMTPQTMAVITRTFPRERRGPANALWGSVAGIASLVGPLLGGVLLDARGWQWIFLVNVPVGIAGFVLAWRLVPKLDTHLHSFDWVGVVVSAIGLFCFVFGLQEGQTYHWGTIAGPLSVPLLLIVGVLFLGFFVWWQARKAREPLVPLRLFGDRNFTVSSIGIACVGFTITAAVVPMMLYFQVVLGLSPTKAALMMAPQAVGGVIMAPVVGRLIDRVHPRTLLVIGLGAMIVGFALMAMWSTVGRAYWQILFVAVVLGLGSSLVWGPLATSANRNLPADIAGAGSGVYNTMRQIGSVLGSAAIAALMDNRLAAHLPGGAAGDSYTSRGHILPPPVLEAISLALRESLWLPTAMLVVAAVAVLFMQAPAHMRQRAKARTGR